MKSLKVLGVVAVLAAMAGGVYVSLHHPPQFPSQSLSQVSEDFPRPEPLFSTDNISTPQGDNLPPPLSGVNVNLGAGMTAEQAFTHFRSTARPESAAANLGKSQLMGDLEPYHNGFSPSLPGSGSVVVGRGVEGVTNSPSGTLPSSPAPWPASWPGTPSAEGSTDAADRDPPRGAISSTTRPSVPDPPKDFASFMAEVNRDLANGRLTAALEKLSRRYDDPTLSPAEYAQLLDLLDQIAYAVIYSPESLLDPPYVVQPGDTLPRIAQSYGVPWQLLARINGITDPNSLVPGQRLKVLRGPFDAEVDLNRRELTLKLHGLYAGRFAIPYVAAPNRLESTYFVEDKSALPGDWWIRLSGGVEIRGEHSLQQKEGATSVPVLAVESDQIENLHTILSVGSRIRIVR